MVALVAADHTRRARRARRVRAEYLGRSCRKHTSRLDLLGYEGHLLDAPLPSLPLLERPRSPCRIAPEKPNERSDRPLEVISKRLEIQKKPLPWIYDLPVGVRLPVRDGDAFPRELVLDETTAPVFPQTPRVLVASRKVLAKVRQPSLTLGLFRSVESRGAMEPDG